MRIHTRQFTKIFVLICAFATFSVFADNELPKIAVYVAGGKDAGEDKAVMTLILAALIESGRYEAVERSHDFVTQINREHETQRSGDVDDSQIMRLGVQAGVQFVCVADLAPAFGAYQISARIIDVETAKVIAIGVAGSDMKSIDEMEILANDVVARMLGLKGGLGESAAEKRMREKAEADKRKKVQIERRKRTEARIREEDAVRHEKEKADKIEQRRQEKAKKAEQQKYEKKLSKLDRDTDAWYIYALGSRFGNGLGGTVEYDGLLTLRKENGQMWEPYIDLTAGYYKPLLNDSTTIYSGINLAAFKGYTLIMDPTVHWHYVIGYGLTGYIGGRSSSGLGGGGLIGVKYRGLRFEEEKDFLIFIADIRLMYCIIFTKGELFTASFGISVSYAF